MKNIKILICCCLLFLACNKKTEINFETLALTDLQGNAVSLNQFKNKTVFVNFWATWCRPCVKEMSNIEITKKILEKEGYEFVFISDESLETLNKFKAKSKYNFRFLKSTKKIEELGIITMPTTFILNKRLEKIGLLRGEQRWESNGHLKLLRQYLNAK